MTDKEQKRIHDFSRENQDAIGESEQCGCFYCRRIFPAADVKKYVCKSKEAAMAVPPLQTTALCPLCGIDSVLPDKAVELSETMLQEMSDEWFT